MKPILLYLLQVIISSGLLYGYYHLFLRNKRFHQYNRYYLLAATVISIFVPFLNIPVYFSQHDDSAVWLQTLSGFTSGREVVTFTAKPTSPVFTWQQALITLYILAGAFILIRFIIAIIRIRVMLRKYEVEQLGDIYFVNTEEQGTPFSFFHWMFWNKKIMLQSEDGQQIFRHELFHIKQKHSWDIVFIELLTIVFWINPFFHLVKKELKAIHEFLADQFAIKENDQWNYAELLLMHLMGTPNLRLTQPFFHNQIKRRIAMITSSQKPKYQYLRKMLVLPLLALIAGLFAFSYKQQQESARRNNELSLKIPDIKGKIVEDTPRKAGRPTNEPITIEATRITLTINEKEAGGADLYILNSKRYTRAEMEKSFNNATINGKMTIYSRNDAEAIKQYGPEAKNGVVVISASRIVIDDKTAEASIVGVGDMDKDPLIILDGRALPKPSDDALSKIEPNSIAIINVFKDQSAISKYGKDGVNGVIEIITKEKEKLRVRDFQIVEDKVEQEINDDVKLRVNDIQVDKSVVNEDVVVTGRARVKSADFKTESDVKLEEVVVSDNPKTKTVDLKKSDLEEVVVTGYPTRKKPATGKMEEIREIRITPSKDPLRNDDKADNKEQVFDVKRFENISPIYPNPATSSITIPYNAEATGDGEIRIVDATGKVMSTRKTNLVKGINNITSDVSSLNKGIYFVVITDNDKKPARIYKLAKD